MAMPQAQPQRAVKRAISEGLRCQDGSGADGRGRDQRQQATVICAT
jgi:hypothetical protein